MVRRRKRGVMSGRKKRRGRGWFDEPERHSLAARGPPCPKCKRVVDERGVHLDVIPASADERRKLHEQRRLAKPLKAIFYEPTPPVYHRWTEAELDILRFHYGIKPVALIQADYLPDRTLDQIRSKAQRIGVAKSRKEYLEG